ncbi:hypothetical protein OJAV_G00005620 [Oryzias javanicus]|uniref:Uncharacterized protein n=1 Tax=Oryzias javanicus TaxID=123683 RepID=A0A437DMI6_ORYJA|nr:hypothetical protein OJAV_G00005620 [Oryzias javanicus]
MEPQLTVVQEEAPDTQFTPAVVVAPEPAADASEQISGYLAPYLLENLYVESGRGGNLEQVQIEDLGPDEEEDESASPVKGADPDLKETMLITAPEQPKMFSLQSLSSPPVPQQYLPGN